MLPEVVSLPSCGLAEQVGLGSAAQGRRCQNGELELAVFPGRGTCTRAGTAPISPARAPEDLAREGAATGMQGRELGDEFADSLIPGQPIQKDLASGSPILGRGRLMAGIP
jgi:hypothetical protein